MAIDHTHLVQFDLNLLVAFDALIAEGSVTRAALRTGVGQSAMSHTTADLIFRVGLPDSMEVLLMPSLLAFLRQHAPGIRLRLHNVGDPAQVLDDLDADRLDMAIGIGGFAGGGTHHKRRALLTGAYLCMFNAALVGLSPPISLADYVRLPHVLTSLRSGERGVVDDALAQLGLARIVALTTLHAQLARLFATALGLSLSPPPVVLPDIAISLLWHASYDQDPAHAWLRQVVARLAGDVARTLLDS
jgi:LysR family transcriptional activator of mexEF-oprN operon